MNEKPDELNNYPQIVLGVILYVNALIIMFIMSSTIVSSRGFLKQGLAEQLIENVNGIPLSDWRAIFLAAGIYASMVFLLFVKTESGAQYLGKLILETVFACMLCYVLNFSYTGIVLLLLADAMRCPFKWRFRMLLTAGFCVLYFVLEGAWLKEWLSVTDVSAYWQYYRLNVRNVLEDIRQILQLLNIFLFILFMVVQLLVQMSEKEQILQLNEELRDVNRRLGQYAREAERLAETRERNRLAREIHDTLGHSLTGIIAGMEACAVLVDSKPDEAKKQMRAIADVARAGVRDVRQSVNALRPDALEKMSVGEALEKMIDETRRSTGVEIDYRCEAEFSGMSQDEEDVIYRIVQESITNAIRHGGASHIDISIKRDYNMLKIHIHDNGAGSENTEEGFGLHHMKERLQMLNGTLSYSGDDGFDIDAAIPIRWGA